MTTMSKKISKIAPTSKVLELMLLLRMAVPLKISLENTNFSKLDL